MSPSTELPPRWEERPLGDLFEILDSRRIPINAKERATRQGRVPYFGATGQVGWINDFIFDEELVLLGEDGAPFLDGAKPKAYVIRGKTWVNNHAHVLRPLGGTPSAFWKYQLDQVQYRPFVSGTTRLKLPQGPMRAIPLRIPPLDEQRRIARDLDSYITRLEDAEATLERVKRNLARYRASVLQAAVGDRPLSTSPEASAWQRLSFGQVAEPISDSGKRVDQRDYKSAGLIPVVDQGETLIGGFTDDEALAYDGPLPVIVFGDHTRRVKLIDFRFAVGAQGVKLLRPTTVWIPEFMAIALRAAPIRNRGYARHYSELRKLEFFVPPLAVQRQVVDAVGSSESLIDTLSQSLEYLIQRIRTLRRAILKSAFSGQLVDQDPTDEPAAVHLERIHAERAKAASSIEESRRWGGSRKKAVKQ